jgi:K+-sensing histidine kinase KdpD
LLINKVSNSIFIKTEAAYFNSILINFISNSIKYKAPKRDFFIKITALESKTQSTVAIEDNGLGMELESYNGNLFTPYSTFHNHVAARGLGVFIPKKIISNF